MTMRMELATELLKKKRYRDELRKLLKREREWVRGRDDATEVGSIGV